MKVCIVSDDMFLSLQHYALKRGHEVYVHVSGVEEKIPADQFAAFPLTPSEMKRLHHVTSIEEAWATSSDLYFIGTQADDYVYEEFKLRARMTNSGLPTPTICGYDRTAIALERNRNLAFDTIRHMEQPSFQVPEQITHRTSNAAAKYLRSSRKNWVVKQHASSPLDRDRNRTVLSSDVTKNAVASMIERLDSSNPWFREDGTGGCVFEQRVNGYEVSFGAWFNGEEFIGPTYLYEEHKGAWSGTRGNIMTGEVGTTMTWFPRSDDCRIERILRELESVLRGHCCGMVDINTILDPETGILWFLEYTMRFGRPTLEMQLAGPGKEIDLIEWWYNSVPESYRNLYTDWPARAIGKTSVGVTVFSYGVPLIEEDEYRYPIEWPRKRVFCHGSSDDKRKSAVSASIMQLFARYSNADKTWSAVSGDRQFVAVGTHADPEIARMAAYSQLEGYEAHELVWRDDIATKTVDVLDSAIRHELVEGYGNGN